MSNAFSIEFKTLKISEPDSNEPVSPEIIQELKSMNIEDSESYTFYKLFPETGKKHQIRKHLSEIMKTPIMGDTLHGYSNTSSRLLFQKTLKYSKLFPQYSKI